MSESIAKRYAAALFELADESYQIEKVHKDMDMIHQSYLNSSDFQDFVKNPVIPVDKRVDVLEEIFSKKIEQITFEFLKLLAQKERLGFLDAIALEFRKKAQESEGILEANVVSAQKLTADQSKDIEARLKKRLGKDIILNASVDDAMLGGLKIKIKDQVFDFSLDDQLKKFKEKVLKG